MRCATLFSETQTHFKTSWNLITVHFGQVRCTLKRLSCCLISVLLFLLFVRISFCHWGFPAEVLHAIQCFYQDNKQWLKHNYMGKLSLLFAYKVVFVKVVRSAHCDFSLATDSLLRKLQSVMPTELDIVRAFADDIAAICSDWWKSIPFLSVLLAEFEEVSQALSLNIAKTVFRCIAPGSRAGHVLGQQQRNRFAQSTRARAWLAHGACKFYR